MKPETSASLKLIAFGLFLLFLIFVGLSVPFYLRQRDVIKNWVFTSAQVQSSEVVSIPEKRGTNYDAHIVVQYRIGESVITTMVNSGYRSSLRSHAQHWVERYPAGSQVTIAYNPVQATDIRLDPGYNSYFFAVPLIVSEVGLGFAILAVVLFVIARRADGSRVQGA